MKPIPRSLLLLQAVLLLFASACSTGASAARTASLLRGAAPPARTGMFARDVAALAPREDGAPQSPHGVMAAPPSARSLPSHARPLAASARDIKAASPHASRAVAVPPPLQDDLPSTLGGGDDDRLLASRFKFPREMLAPGSSLDLLQLGDSTLFGRTWERKGDVHGLGLGVERRLVGPWLVSLEVGLDPFARGDVASAVMALGLSADL